MKKTIAVIGGGPAGMMAAYTAACTLRKAMADDVDVLLYERNPMLGKKLRITGKGRCNVTNNCTPAEFREAVTRNQKFLYGASSRFTSADTMAFFESFGVPLKTERGRRVFPVSDKAADIALAMERALADAGVRVYKGVRVSRIEMPSPDTQGDISTGDGEYCPVRILAGDRWVSCDALIVATGGVSYPGTGSTGDGHRMLDGLGIPVTELKPSLVPIETKENTAELMGLTLKNVTLSACRGEKKIFEEQGEMLFTHFGLTGPLVLSASANMQKGSVSDYRLFIDLKPALTEEELDRRLLSDFARYSARDFCNSLDDLLPKRLIPWVIRVSGIPERCKTASITKVQRQKLLTALKALPFTPTKFRPLEEAVVTCGGVEVSAVSPKDMMLKKHPGLFCAGELLDLDAYTGGYNLQIAFSTGVLAGQGAAEFVTGRK
ncbi:MAG: NAD(P)/FAD-dependent oxidoreductase [Clostridia bacterium]|nr:NAD(P)/FAD-dependent oxidoreductase [Clostridia bacterium]